MQIEIKLATQDDINRLSRMKKKDHREHIRVFAPIAFQDQNVEPKPLMGFSKEGLGKHGAYEDEDTAALDMYAPILGCPLSFIIDYPLNHPALIEFSGKEEGFSMADLISGIKAAYEGIYKMEEGDTPAPGEVTYGPLTLANRPSTDGMFGIWGHVIHDLAIEAIDTFRFEDGAETIYPTVGS